MGRPRATASWPRSGSRRSELDAAVVLVHRKPEEVLASLGAYWSRSVRHLGAMGRQINRASMVLCSELPAMVIGYERMAATPKPQGARTGGVRGAVRAFRSPVAWMRPSEIIERIPRLDPSIEEEPNGPSTPSTGSWPRWLDRLDGRHGGKSDHEPADAPRLVAATSNFYNEDYYYGTSYDKSGIPYRKERAVLGQFFGRIAGLIVDTIGPRDLVGHGMCLRHARRGSS